MLSIKKNEKMNFRMEDVAMADIQSVKDKQPALKKLAHLNEMLSNMSKVCSI
jgi:hypothetical protein